MQGSPDHCKRFKNDLNCLTPKSELPYNSRMVSYNDRNAIGDTTLRFHTVNTSTRALLSKRVLKLNVGYLLNAGPGNHKDIPFEIQDRLRVADDLVAETISGKLRLTRTKEGVLVQTRLTIHMERECARCLATFIHEIPVVVEELYAYPQPLPETEFYIGMDAKLDLSPLLRAEVLIALSHREYCRGDCQGLCAQCGTNLNYETCDCETDNIDPRMAKLKELLDAGD